MKVELLSPAGSYESLRAAVNAGADAVYLGGSMFGARAFAQNLSGEDLLKAIDYVHVHGKKIYMTLNTLLKEEEIEEKLYDYLLPYYRQGLDALIVQDWGAVRFVRRHFPDIAIHASTQMAVMGKYGARILKDNGISRIVTPRELSLGEIREIRDDSDIEIESFVHGALCYSYSGQCLMSSMLGGRSGNRGRCAQPCRLPYTAMKDEKTISQKEEAYPISPKDICTLRLLPEILEAGVGSLKIEGRMKSPAYSGGVTAIYRKYLDLYEKNGTEGYHVEKNDLEYLEALYSRNGFSEGYYRQHNSRNMITLNKSTYSSDKDIKNEKDEMPDIHKKIHCRMAIQQDKEVRVEIFDDTHHIIYMGGRPYPAQNKPLTIENVVRQMMKTGGSSYCFQEVEVELDDGLFIPVGDLNGLRRNALEMFTQELLKKYRRILHNSPEIKAESETEKRIKPGMKLNCMVTTLEQFEKVMSIPEIDRIYLDYESTDLSHINAIADRCHAKRKQLFLSLPPVFRSAAANLFEKHFENMEQSCLDGYLVKSLDEYGYLDKRTSKTLVFDASMYSLNSEAERMYKEWGAESIALPYELNHRELKRRITGDEELVVYGYIPLMISAGCVKKTLGKCDKKQEYVFLKDRYNKYFTVKSSCGLCYNTIYNSQPLSLLGVSDKVEGLGVAALRLDFTKETAEETARIAKDFVKVFCGGDTEVLEITGFTRGHFNRGIE
ncbi:peptidase U32 family protein [Parasporobacterium paucivorans]|uniref:Putative protease n=1 Tax=Parasporobacterium paucivorans DSM 15970 TaxID=1122934 RepID=A0A1M6ABQ2_9FIRM|nr:U32 family peptidase [Parasporobacterium paucivorans]SHI33879.1 putative protease [Parasporobacterium paucivorans DSM 15970]